MNILIALNEGYIRQAKMMIYSLRKHNEVDITIYLVHTEISEENINNFRFYIENVCECELKVIKIDNSRLEGLPLFAHYTYEIYYRLLAIDDLLPLDMERILWLDSDIIVKANIQELYNNDFEDMYLCACEDMVVKSEHLLNFIDIPQNEKIRYFNSGVILFNLKKIRKNNKAKELFDFLRENKDRVQMPDQDALNVVFYKGVKYVESKKYNNLMFTLVKVDKDKKQELENEACIIHYVGVDKPWFYKYQNSSFKYYWDIERENGNKKEYVLYWLKHYMYIIVRKIYLKIKG